MVNFGIFPFFAQADDDAGVPGCLFGRYPGDVYAGGNPWPLLTAAAAEVFYLGGSVNARNVPDRGEERAFIY